MKTSNIKMDKVKIVIFGTGLFYENRKDSLEKDTIVAYIDNDINKQNSSKWKIYDPKYILQIDFDYVVIMSKAYNEMEKQLLDYGISKEKIVSYDTYIKNIKRVSKKPDISIILPVYNSYKYIAETLDVILNQTFTNFELIIVDDCPTDDTMEIVKKIRDNRMYIIHNPKNMGVSYSRNLGIENSRGEYIVFMDHDDTMPLNRLEKQINFLKSHKEIDAVGGKTMYMDGKSRIKSTFNEIVPKNPKYIRVKLLETNIFINSAVMYRKSVIIGNNIRYWDNSYGLDDYIFLAEVSKHGLISGIDDVVHFYRVHESNTLQKVFKEQGKERIEKRNEFYHYTYAKEGFQLSEEQYNTILEAFAENRIVPITFKLFGELMILFDELLEQAEGLGLNYIEELKQWMEEIRYSLR